VSTIVKGVKACHGGEYSRELSRQGICGANPLIELGYRQGGQPASVYAGSSLTSRVHPRARLRVASRRACRLIASS